MITLYVGNIGSGKTLAAVRYMANRPNKIFYSNINTFGLSNVKKLEPWMIREKVTDSRGKLIKYKINIDFWSKVEKPVNIVLDEVHSVLNSRKSMSKENIAMTDFLALLRKMLGRTNTGYGDLIIITQLIGRADTILRQMAHRIVYFVNHYIKECTNCGCYFMENSDMPEQKEECPQCGLSLLYKKGDRIEVKHFANEKDFELWKNNSHFNTFYKNYIINDVAEYFKYYDTMQIENLFSDD